MEVRPGRKQWYDHIETGCKARAIGDSPGPTAFWGYPVAMAFDPLNSARNREPSEYGGDNGLIQPKAKGHELTPKEKRSYVTREALDSATVMEDIPVTDLHYPAVVELQKRRAARAASGHTLDDAME